LQEIYACNRKIRIDFDSAMKSDVASSVDRWVTTREVADRLSIHLNTVANYIKRGEFGQVLVLSVKDKRVRNSAIERFINSRLA